MPDFITFRTNDELIERIRKGRLKDDSLNEQVLGDAVKHKPKPIIQKTLLPDVKLSIEQWKKHLSLELFKLSVIKEQEAEQKHKEIQERFELKVA
jgi:hypothetical protein